MDESNNAQDRQVPRPRRPAPEPKGQAGRPAGPEAPAPQQRRQPPAGDGAGGTRGPQRQEQPQQERRLTGAELEARVVAELCLPAYLHDVLGVTEVGPLGAKAYMEQFVGEATGQAGDPVERLMLQQVLFLHFRLARLHSQAAQAKALEEIKVLNSAAARLAGEMRRAVLALKAYRAPAGPKAVNFIKMQAVAERQEVQFVDGGQADGQGAGRSDERIVIEGRGELGGNGHGERPASGRFGGRFSAGGHDGGDVTAGPEAQEPAAGGGRAGQRLEAAGVVG